MTLGAGLVLSGCGDDTPATTPAPAPPPPPPPAPEPEPEPEPEAPATPTGLHVDETTQTSITWTWTASEGALGYAVQVSHDEMFDDTDQIALTTETSFTAADIPPQTSLYVRVAAGTGTPEALAAAVAGDLSGLALSAWTTHVTGMSAMPPPPVEPMAPATPTGLMAEEGEGSITWSWDMVEGADGYAIQVSTDEMFDDMDEMTYTMETMHTASELGYSATRFARVASTSGEGDDMLMSMWTTHVTGMSMAKAAPVVPALAVSFKLSAMAKKPTYLIATLDKYKDDKEKATGTVNTEITVESNHYPVAITPMFEAAAGIGLVASDAMAQPFTNFTAAFNQKMAVEDGVTFMVQRMTVGANQEMEPDGDVAYVTCNPFECMTGEDRPEYDIENSAACNMWEPALELQVGLIDNDGKSHIGRAAVEDTDADQGGNQALVPVRVFDGLDLGWTYKSGQKFNATHDLAVLSAKQGGSKGFASGSDKPLAVDSIGAVNLGQGVDADDTDLERYYALSAEAEDPEEATGSTAGTPVTTDPADLGSCFPVSRFLTDVSDPASPTITRQEALWAYSDNVRSQISRPDNCFRITVDKSLGRNYLDAYEVTLSPLAANVSWGAIAWPEFKELECGGEPFEATDQVNVCELFEAELDRALDAGWKIDNAKEEVVYGYTQGDDASEPLTLQVKFDPKGMRRQFATLPFDHDGKATKSSPMIDFYAVDTDTDAEGNQPAMIEINLLDEDGDPKYGDIGKVDNTKPDGDDDGDDPDPDPDGKADNYLGTTDADCTDDDGGTGASLCDAEHTFDVDVAFNAGLGAICEDVERTLSVTCEWDAQGEIRRGRTDSDAQDVLWVDDDTDEEDKSASFLSCTIKSP